jgi:hypothetical protein
MHLDAPMVAVSPSGALATPVPAPSSTCCDVERTGPPLAAQRKVSDVIGGDCPADVSVERPPVTSGDE